MASQRDEADLIKAARAGDGGAFADLITPHYDKAFGLARWLLNDPGESEDAVQEAVDKAWRKLAQLHDGAPIRPWFLGIVWKQCLSMRRSRWRSVLRFATVDRESELPDLAASIDLRRAVSRLKYDDRVALHLRYTLDLSFEEVAAALGISEKAARTRAERAVKKLRLLMPEVAR